MIEIGYVMIIGAICFFVGMLLGVYVGKEDEKSQ
jgi:hypothetical protein